MFRLHRLLWDLRADPALADRLHHAPESVLAEYDLDPADRSAFAAGDFKTLYERGANPYLLYFCALAIGVDRGEYYARLRSGEVSRG